MGKEYTAKSFKSGNSVAIRMPAALGVEPDREWAVARDESGDLVLRVRQPEATRIDLSAVYGAKPGLKPLSGDERVISDRPFERERVSERD